jgi:deoxycytidylate deaminase
MPSSPCVDCARAIIGAGFIEVISDGDEVYNRTQRYKEKGVEAYTEYKEDHKIVINMFEDKGIPWRIHYGAL